jgi:hypothetical protein
LGVCGPELRGFGCSGPNKPGKKGRVADLGSKRFTRLTNGFSRKLFNHEAALGLHFACYNFVTRHTTLKTTPAVAAGIADDRWTAEQLIEMTAAYKAPNEPTAFERFLDKLPDEDE